MLSLHLGLRRVAAQSGVSVKLVAVQADIAQHAVWKRLEIAAGLSRLYLIREFRE